MYQNSTFDGTTPEGGSLSQRGDEFRQKVPYPESFLDTVQPYCHHTYVKVYDVIHPPATHSGVSLFRGPHFLVHPYHLARGLTKVAIYRLPVGAICQQKRDTFHSRYPLLFAAQIC